MRWPWTRRECEHSWAGWWIAPLREGETVGDEATNDCIWCHAKWTERLAVPVPLRPLRRLQPKAGPR